MNGKRVLKIITSLTLCTIMMNFMFINSHAKTFNIDKAALYSKGTCKELIRKTDTGGVVDVEKVFYKSNGKEYPAYCLDIELDGVGKVDGYTVTINKVVDNELVRRVMLNGYPYKSLNSLGVKNVDEAFTATKLAVYCILYNYDKNNFERYEGIGTAGKRTLSAMKKIVKAARNSKEEYISPDISISEVNSKWNIDEKNSDYISKKFKVNSKININSFSISIIDSKIDGIKITNLQNKEQTSFLNEKEFKILIPIEKIKEDGKVNLKIDAKMESKPILYGKAPNKRVQNYALAGISYETVVEDYETNYKKENTKIIIEKKAKEEDINLTSAIFNIYDKNKKLIYENIEVNEEGKIVLNDILPGKYYIKEVKAPKGYEKIKELIEVNVNYGEEKVVKIKNSKIKIEIPKETIKKLPLTGY